jgi:hypothetical protein
LCGFEIFIQEKFNQNLRKYARFIYMVEGGSEKYRAIVSKKLF